MRALLIAAALAFTTCASAGAEPVIGDPNAPWRQQAAGASPADHAAAQACLARGGNCEMLFQTPCLNAYDEDERSPAVARRCDWHAMAVWEDEIVAMLSDLRSKLGGDDLRNLNASEAAWERSMLADVALGMDYYSGGSISGPAGAHIRARAAAQRAAYLYEIQQMVDE
jgi:hypothetical protein